MKKPSKYERIMSRPDKRRPPFVMSLGDDLKFLHPHGLVLSATVLNPSGVTCRFTWSEKSADESAIAERGTG